MAENRLGFELNSTLEQDFAKNPPNNPVWNALNEVSKRIYVDSLTGCYNRNFYENFKTENFDPNRDHNKLALIFIDLNGFKKINDTKGHYFGDELIKETGNFLKENCRKEDIVFRYGGDEFIIVCKNNDNNKNFEKDIYRKAEEIRLKKSPIDFAFGVAVFNKSIDSSLTNTQHRADKAMYEYKEKIKSAN